MFVSEELIAFADGCDRAGSLRALEPLWRARVQTLGFTYVAIGAHMDPLAPARASYVFQNYPAGWIERFSAQRYHLIDPVFRAVERGLSGFEWTDPAFVSLLSWRQRRILSEAREFGLRFGRTHALSRAVNLRASASLVMDAPEMDANIWAAVRLTNMLVHQRAAELCAAMSAPLPELSRRERECLELCASGLTDEQCAQKLGISVATVRRHIEAARVRFGVSTRTQAAVRAIRSGQIHPYL